MAGEASETYAYVTYSMAIIEIAPFMQYPLRFTMLTWSTRQTGSNSRIDYKLFSIIDTSLTFVRKHQRRNFY